MKTNKLIVLILTAVLSTICLASISITTKAAADTATTIVTAKQYKVSVLAGQDRYDTSNKIANEYIKDANNGVVLALGSGFADALSGSVLAQKYKMPILLCGATSSESQTALSFIKSNVSTSKPIYILGGAGAIKDEVINTLKSQGYSNITRLGGLDRYDTNSKIIDNFSAKEGTPVVIANGENFPDALSISSIASAKGYPILLTATNSMSDEIKAKLKAIKPSKIYIAGGTASVSDANLNEIKSLSNLDSSNIVRLGGADRYDTSLAIAKYFNSDSDTITFANGEGFADALSGSALSAQKGSSLLLVSNSDVSKQKQYVDTTKSTSLLFYGGDGVIPEATRNALGAAFDPLKPTPTQPTQSYMSVNILNDKDYSTTNKIVVKYDKTWTFTFSEPVNAKDLDIQIWNYGHGIDPNGVIGDGYHQWSTDDVKKSFVFQQLSPTQVKVFKGSVDRDGTTYNDGYDNGDYRIIIGADSKAVSGKILGKDFKVDFTTIGAGGLMIEN